MTAIKIGHLSLGVAAWLGGMSLAWSVSAATPAGAPTASDFSRCAGCHSTQAGQNKIGPSLAGVVGRSSGSVPGYHYSDAMKNAHLTWTSRRSTSFCRAQAGWSTAQKCSPRCPTPARGSA